MKRITLLSISAVAAAFGLLTVFMSSSVIFDLFNIRAAQGNYVPFVVWANFFSGMLFVVAGIAFFNRKRWSPGPLLASLAILAVALVGLAAHINAGGAYETKTVAAMIFRITVNGALAMIMYASVRKHQTSRFRRPGMLLVLPLILLAISCGQRPDTVHERHGDAAHHHEEMAGPLTLNNGEKWEADAHTLSVVDEMKSEVADFTRRGTGSHHALADSLTHQLNILINGCTMEGAAHEELHKWLVPVTKSISDLSAVKDAAGARAEIKNIEHSLHEFDEFFARKK